MSWDKIIGQQRIKTVLQRALKENRIAQAYLFYGLDGIGKEAMALEFAKTVNCTNKHIESGVISACGFCQSCKQAASLQHQNIMLVYSLPTGKAASGKSDSPLSTLSDDQISEIQEQIQLKAEDNYHRITINGANQIKIASIRELKKNLSLSPNKEGRRFVIIARTEEMTSEAANALLKTLEEPNEKITIILTTSRQDLMLDTILSRTQQLQFQPLDEAEIAQALTSKNGIPPEEAKVISAVSQGSYSIAKSFLNTDMGSIREEAIEMFRNSLKKKGFRTILAKKAEDMAKAKDKQKMITFLNVLALWFKDAVAIIYAGDTARLINEDRRDQLIRFAENFSEKDFFLINDIIEKSIVRINRNVQPQLVFLSTMIKIRNVLL